MDIKWRRWVEVKPPCNLSRDVSLIFRYRRAKIRNDFIDEVCFSDDLNRDGLPSFSYWNGWSYNIPSEEHLEWAFDPYHSQKKIWIGFEDKLLPSPFDGSRPRVDYYNPRFRPWSPESFTLTHTLGSKKFDHPQKLIDAWNNRCK